MAGGRPQNPVKDAGPIGEFALRLRARREQAKQQLGDSLTFRAMASKARYSHSVLAGALAGEVMPTLPVVEAMLTIFGATGAEIEEWRVFFAETTAAVMNLRRKNGDVAVAVYSGDRGFVGLGDQAPRLRPIQASPLPRERQLLDPASVTTFDDLRYQLEVMRIAAGNPALKKISVHTGIPQSTLAEVFNGRRRPKFATFSTIVDGLYGMTVGKKGRPLRDLWDDAWFQAEFNRTRPDLTRSHRYGNVYLISDHQDEGPTTAVIAEMKVEVAAALLAGLPPKVSSGIIAELLPTGKAHAILEAMWALTGKVDPRPPASTLEVSGSGGGDTAAEDEAV